MRALRPLLWLFLVLVGAQWVVFTQVGRLPIFRTWLDDPSFGVYMPAELALNLIVTLVVIAALFVLKRDRRAFYLAKGDLSAPAEPIGWLGVKPGDRWNTVGRNLDHLHQPGHAGLPGHLRAALGGHRRPGAAVPAGRPAGRRPERVQRGGDLQGLVPVGAGGARGLAPGAADGRGLLRARPLLRHPVRGHRRGAGLVPGLDPGEVHAGDAWPHLGLVHPLRAGRARSSGSWRSARSRLGAADRGPCPAPCAFVSPADPVSSPSPPPLDHQDHRGDDHQHRPDHGPERAAGHRAAADRPNPWPIQTRPTSANRAASTRREVRMAVSLAAVVDRAMAANDRARELDNPTVARPAAGAGPVARSVLMTGARATAATRRPPSMTSRASAPSRHPAGSSSSGTTRSTS